MCDVVIGASDFLDLDLAAVARKAGSSFQEGSLRAYYGKRLEMGAAVVIADLDRGRPVR